MFFCLFTKVTELTRPCFCGPKNRLLPLPLVYCTSALNIRMHCKLWVVNKLLSVVFFPKPVDYWLFFRLTYWAVFCVFRACSGRSQTTHRLHLENRESWMDLHLPQPCFNHKRSHYGSKPTAPLSKWLKMPITPIIITGLFNDFSTGTWRNNWIFLEAILLNVWITYLI